MKFRYMQIKNKEQFSQDRNKISFIVIHDTGNPGTGANAIAHYNYLKTATRKGSAHYYVDDKEIIQTIGDSMTAWSVGDKWARQNRTRDDVNNYNSISIELCINRDSDSVKAYKNLLELTKNLMKNFNIPADNVVRHFDASGKPCPNSWQPNNWKKWWQFKEDIRRPIEWTIDLNKDSEFGPGKNEDVKEVIEMLEKWQEEQGKKALKELGDKGLIEPDKWENHLGESTPNWLLFTMLARLAK